jgi:hypothetical protein
MFRPNDYTEGHLAIDPKKCPNCKTLIRASYRYGDVIKPQLAMIEGVKKKLAEERYRMSEEFRRKEREQVMNALSADLGNNAAGKWFYCPNGHLYCIGECGGATQIGKVLIILSEILLEVLSVLQISSYHILIYL